MTLTFKSLNLDLRDIHIHGLNLVSWSWVQWYVRYVFWSSHRHTDIDRIRTGGLKKHVFWHIYRKTGNFGMHDNLATFANIEKFFCTQIFTILNYTSALPMGCPPWLARRQTDSHLIVWWSRHSSHRPISLAWSVIGTPPHHSPHIPWRRSQTNEEAFQIIARWPIYICMISMMDIYFKVWCLVSGHCNHAYVNPERPKLAGNMKILLQQWKFLRLFLLPLGYFHTEILPPPL